MFEDLGRFIFPFGYKLPPDSPWKPWGRFTVFAFEGEFYWFWEYTRDRSVRRDKQLDYSRTF